VHFIPLHVHPYYRERYALQPSDFPNAWAAYERIVSLPIYAKMTDDDVRHVIDAVREIAQEAAR
jgi:perosamine synthetase